MNLVKLKRQILILAVCLVCATCSSGKDGSVDKLEPPPTTNQQDQNLFSKLKTWFSSNQIQDNYYGQQLPMVGGIPMDIEQEDEPPFSIDLSQYEDETVMRFNWTSAKEHDRFLAAAETLILDVWSIRDDSADVRINKHQVRDFLRLLPKGMRHESRRSVYIEDLQRAVLSTIPMSSSGEHFFDDYRDLDEISNWLVEKLRKASIKLGNIGHTFESRSIQTVQIGNGPFNVVVTSGLHAREWITISSSLYALEKLLDDAALMDKVSITFIPVANPDGYAYSWVQDRLWRKNRQSTGVAMCLGLDLSRSLLGDGTKRDTKTSSKSRDNACSETFAGKSPLQAVEAAVIAEMIHKEETQLYVDLDSYTQQLSSLKATEKLSTEIRKKTGRDYEVVGAVLQEQVQQAEQGLEGPAFYQVRLPDVDHNGFLMHKRNIRPIGEEFASILKILIGAELAS